MELKDSLTLLFICSKIHCYLLPLCVSYYSEAG